MKKPQDAKKDEQTIIDASTISRNKKTQYGINNANIKPDEIQVVLKSIKENPNLPSNKVIEFLSQNVFDNTLKNHQQRNKKATEMVDKINNAYKKIEGKDVEQKVLIEMKINAKTNQFNDCWKVFNSMSTYINSEKDPKNSMQTSPDAPDTTSQINNKSKNPNPNVSELENMIADMDKSNADATKKYQDTLTY